ncbi:polygalacturonase QRT3 [Ziziphus jujuba]|uniref:Polygalacturonase QRT3 n=1 Tax=Ziziphus jujuba TaxID=326968 RepID=A0A6P4AXR5_ZIZJJ|nr:polygalacturonase QRT3 [Ziziphus jujuba]
MAGKNIIIINAVLTINIVIIINSYYLGIKGAEASYSGATTTSYRRQLQISHPHITTITPSSSSAIPVAVPPQTNSRVHHVIDYGADPTGLSDSTEALERALSDAFRSSNNIRHSHLMQGVTDLGGTQLHLDGGTYKISRPLRLPLPHDDASGSGSSSAAGNFMIHGGSLCASDNFPSDAHLIELPSSSSYGYGYEHVTLKDLTINSNFRGGGISIVNSLRTTVENCYISHFTTNGILVRAGHETYIRNSFIGQHINVGGDPNERDFSGIGINIAGNDNAVTDVVIFSASIGILVSGQANVFSGVHCYNKATALGGTGIYIRAPGFTQTRILNSYFDFTGIVAEDPVQLHIAGSFFLGNAFISIKSLNGVLSGVSIVDNMFSGDYTGVQIVQLDQSTGPPFTRIDQVLVDRNSVRGMTLRSTVAKGSVWSNGTRWTVDFSPVLLFPNLIKHVHYTLQAGAAASFPNHVLRNVSGNRITVESDVPLSATLHASVDQTVVAYT